jgi:hypothetical protein
MLQMTRNAAAVVDASGLKLVSGADSVQMSALLKVRIRWLGQ